MTPAEGLYFWQTLLGRGMVTHLPYFVLDLFFYGEWRPFPMYKKDNLHCGLIGTHILLFAIYTTILMFAYLTL
jgi:hypothetical protein